VTPEEFSEWYYNTDYQTRRCVRRRQSWRIVTSGIIQPDWFCCALQNTTSIPTILTGQAGTEIGAETLPAYCAPVFDWDLLIRNR
jgi:hypothetical protein